jgi:hypothetical protein
VPSWLINPPEKKRQNGRILKTGIRDPEREEYWLKVVAGVGFEPTAFRL